MSFPIAYVKGSNARASKFFQVFEFDCPCVECDTTKIDPESLKLLDLMRAILGVPLTVNRGGGYRCDFYQQNLTARGYETAKGISTHQLGMGFDVSAKGKTGSELEGAARKAGFRAVGRALTWVHVDGRRDRDRAWLYTKRQA